MARPISVLNSPNKFVIPSSRYISVATSCLLWALGRISKFFLKINSQFYLSLQRYCKTKTISIIYWYKNINITSYSTSFNFYSATSSTANFKCQHSYHHKNVFYSYFSTMLPICRNCTLYHPPFLDLQSIRDLGLTIH